MKKVLIDGKAAKVNTKYLTEHSRMKETLQQVFIFLFGTISFATAILATILLCVVW